MKTQMRISHGLDVNVMDCDILGEEFELQSQITFYFGL